MAYYSTKTWKSATVSWMISILENSLVSYEIWGPHSSANEYSSLLGHYTVCAGKQLPTIWQACCLHLQLDPADGLFTVKRGITFQEPWFFGLISVLKVEFVPFPSPCTNPNNVFHVSSTPSKNARQSADSIALSTSFFWRVLRFPWAVYL